jgi:hypothetical protein
MGSVTKLSRTRAPRSELIEVLRLINVGRKALRMAPLREIPKGVMDHEHECSLARAFERVVYPNAGGVEKVVLDTGKEARALMAAFNTDVEEDDPRNVILPFPLTRFSRRFDKGGYPDLIDHDTMSTKVAAERLGISLATVEELVEAELISVIRYDCDGVPDSLIRWSTLKSAFTIPESLDKPSSKRRAA